MGYILNQLLNGICQGSIYALMAIGYSVIVGVVGMVTFAYGEVMMIGAFSAYYIFIYVGNNLPLAILAAFAGSCPVGGRDVPPVGPRIRPFVSGGLPVPALQATGASW